MLKVLITDEKENADIIAAVMKKHYEPIAVDGEKGLKERLLADKPDMILVTADNELINYKKILGDLIRRNPEFSAMPAALICSSPKQDVVTAAGILSAEVIVRPFEPLDFLTKLHRMSETLKPLKDRIDFVTGLHKREYTEERIKELFPKKSGTLFIIDIAKFRFACQPISEQISAQAAAAVVEDLSAFNAILGVQKDRKLIGYLPDINEKSICMGWAKQVISNIQSRLGDQKVYISIGFACNDEKSPEYKDLYQTCDRALNLAREKGSNIASYY